MTTRPLGDLLMLDTYQDMTDEEIQTLIDYKVSEAVNAELLSYKAQAAAEEASRIQNHDASAQETANDLYARILARWESVINE